MKENKVRLVNKIWNKKEAFTIIELLTVMSIIVILISLLVPSLSMVRRYARKVRQRAQFHSINIGMEAYNPEFEGYPDSDEVDDMDMSYCGAMKLCEAMVGQDLMGFHPESRFRLDCTNGVGTKLYSCDPLDLPPTAANLKLRKGPYLQLENANAYKLKHLYGKSNVGDFEGFGAERFVLCDVYKRIVLTPDVGDPADAIKGKAGMPILYYKANLFNTIHYDPNSTLAEYIYDFYDNDELVELGKPWDATGGPHPLWNNPVLFYEMIRNKKITTTNRPHRPDSYILLSAGFDGEYGTNDDIFNFFEP
jgi:type II secretory pathway pseudopilin PulG